MMLMYVHVIFKIISESCNFIGDTEISIVLCEECTFIVVSDMRECQEWIDTINFVAASYSAPCQLDVTEQKRFQRPLLPASCTTLNLVIWLLCAV